MNKDFSAFMAKHFSWSGQNPTPEELWNAATQAAESKCKCLQLQKKEECPACKGSGDDPDYRHGSIGKCPACDGTGKRSFFISSVDLVASWKKFKNENKDLPVECRIALNSFVLWVQQQPH